MHTLAQQIQKLAPAPEDALALWLRPTHFIARLDPSGNSLRPAGPISATLLTAAATKLLPTDDDVRRRAEALYAKAVANTNRRGMPWPATGTTDQFSGAYTTGRVLFDLSVHVSPLIKRPVANRALRGLASW